jgi:FkbM family methyltransferase
MISKAKRSVSSLIRRFGYEIVPREVAPTMDAALARAGGRIEVGTVIDVGASDGRWSREAMRHFPRARYLLVEAQEDAHGDALRRFAADHRGVEIAMAAAGDREGTVTFDVSSPFGGGVAPARRDGGGSIVPMTTVDLEVKRRDLPPPYLLKLDTHGFEIPILDGASGTLAAASLLVIEAYNFDLGNGGVRFPELCRDLELRGFRPADLADPMWRPGDGFLWQMDLFFVKKDRPEFASNAYA